MTQNNPIQMFDLLFFCDLETINKDFGLRFGDNKEFFSLLNDGTVAFINSKGIEFDIVLVDLVSTDGSLSLLESI